MRTLLYIFIVFLFIQSNTLADIHYVSKTGSSTPPYLSWDTAADSIKKAITVCNNGDTVLIANGTYYEYLYVDKTINLIGTSMDSCIINGSSSPDEWEFQFYHNSSLISNLTITGPGMNVPGNVGCYIVRSNIKIINCKITNIRRALWIDNSSPVIENTIFSEVYQSIREECPSDTCHGIYRNNIIFSSGGATMMVYFFYGGSPSFTNNIMIEEGDLWIGLYGGTLRGITVKNNLISGYITEGIHLSDIGADSAFIINNTVVHNSTDTMFGSSSITTGTGKRTKIKNNIVAHSPRGIEGYQINDATRADYNLFWDVTKLTLGNASLGDSNIVADPMFINDTVPTSQMTYDYHLQKYSPAIDKGDPTILDRDGTRSDMGMFGGPGGDAYTYMDLSPRAPVNLSAFVTINSIKLKWNKNSEADTAFYSVYMDTTANFQIDTLKRIAKGRSNEFVYQGSSLNKHYYFKVTATDSAGNESAPSAELHVHVTGLIDNRAVEITDYNLYQNYPNPFNPTTKIPYRIKEPGYVKLMVYNITGELIKILVNKEQEPGYYEAEFDGKGLSSGIYLYRIEVIGKGNIPVYSDMKKTILLK